MIALSLILLAAVFPSCSSITGGAEDKDELYKEAIERYYVAVISYDVDTLLDCLDPLGPAYPDVTYIEQLRADAVGKTSPPGEILVKKLITLEESGTRAIVKVTLYMNVDFDNNGEFFEETYYPTFELTFKEGLWRIFSASVEE
jgi:hypothetical protein